MRARLLLRIERQRRLMHRLAAIHGLSSTHVLRASRKLDELLNEWEEDKRKAPLTATS